MQRAIAKARGKGTEKFVFTLRPKELTQLPGAYSYVRIACYKQSKPREKHDVPAVAHCFTQPGRPGLFAAWPTDPQARGVFVCFQATLHRDKGASRWDKKVRFDRSLLFKWF